ncbi:hypothetical protein BKP64_11005 [Marinobacter salinus]|uniref:Bacteriophage tail tape measure C-terminal domain-containing protein n=1 Tax=Marinobacter salinus TaxID=1874317 RepID=A0A1D9GLZ3_9GAMM|nr:hypothetical protein [Marinobacter salinus]AOY88657.1 hypothetical protein BKP64_11005 [Marinobacter salinus]
MASKSLGTLTLDLIAKVGGFEAGMDKAARKSKKTSTQIEKHANSIAKAVAGMSVAAVGGLTAMVTSTAESAREIKNLSALSNASTQQFQKMAFAASRYGVEQDKVSDILKDTNDRIGDFIQTGGGPMADFFENIAPLVGVTADQFARLSGPEALQLYVDSLEKAGVSQKDMTFYMEAIAGDAAKLIPLLRDNGKAMKDLGDEAERTGNVFSDADFADLEKITASTDELQASLKGISNEVVLAAIPAINDLTSILSDESTLKSAQALGTAVVSAMNKAVEAVDGAIKVTQFLAEELAAMTAGAAADDIVRLEDELETLYSMLDNPTNRVRFFGKDGVVAYYDKDEIWQMIADTENKIVDFRNRLKSGSRAGPVIDLVDTPDTPNAPSSNGISRTGKAARDAAEGITELEKSLAEMRAELDPAMAEFDRYANQIDQIEQFNITAAEKEKLREAAFAEHQNRMIEIAGESRQEMFEQEASYWEQWMEAAEKNLENFDELSRTVIDNFATGFGNAFESVIFDAQSLDDALKGIGETILRSIVNAIGQMAAQWIALQAVQAVVGTSATAATVGQAAAASAAWSTPAALASLATAGANAIPASAAIVSTTSLAKGLSLAGMAHEGIDAIPNEGTWLLDKGERVMSSPQADDLDAFLASQKKNNGGGNGGAPIINVTEAPGRGGDIQSRRNEDGRFVIDIMVEQFNTHGPGSEAAQAAFGLKRQGY